jgi:hypothetical protein
MRNPTPDNQPVFPRCRVSTLTLFAPEPDLRLPSGIGPKERSTQCVCFWIDVEGGAGNIAFEATARCKVRIMEVEWN